jgi:FecR protein
MSKSTFIAALTLIAASTTGALAQSKPVGVNAAIRNNVMMKTASDVAMRKAVLRERVALGDSIQTAQASVLQILLLDRTSFTVGANAKVKIDRFVYNPDRKASAVSASVARGAFRFMSGKTLRGAPGQSSITTPAASIGIRGTIFEGAVGADAVRIARGESGLGGVAGADPNTATLIVLRGPGNATQGDEKVGAIDVTAGGQTVAVETPGLALFVPRPDAKPIGPFMISDAGLDALHALLRTSPDARRGRSVIGVDGNPVVDQTFECEGSFAAVSPGLPAAQGSGCSRF